MKVDNLESIERAPNSNFPKEKTLSNYLIKIAKLGGYLARAKDPPPENIVIWRGMARLANIELGFKIASQSCG